jgi:hypothetical protein
VKYSNWGSLDASEDGRIHTCRRPTKRSQDTYSVLLEKMMALPSSRVHWTLGILRDLQAFFPGLSVQDRLASSFFLLPTESTSALAPVPCEEHTGLMQTVNRLN